LQAEASDGPIRKYADIIRRSTDRMNRLIADLLDLASIEAGRLVVTRQHHDAAVIARDVVELQLPIATPRRLRLEAHLPDQPLMVRCDRDRVLQVLANLIGNAIKFTPAGGEIAVELIAHEGAARFGIVDTGPGIPPEHVPHLFDRYWQGKQAARGGVGLGLSIAKGLVEAHGGRIWVVSTPGQGAAFYFTIPLDP
jgi:signal transduction histidine kinase